MNNEYLNITFNNKDKLKQSYNLKCFWGFIKTHNKMIQNSNDEDC